MSVLPQYSVRMFVARPPLLGSNGPRSDLSLIGSRPAPGRRRDTLWGPGLGRDGGGFCCAVAYVLGDGTGLRSVPERFLSGRGARPDGSATPMEMMYLRASSTLMSSSIVSERGRMRKKPAVMLGVVGTKTEICSRPRSSATSCSGVPVTSATVQLPPCG